MRSILIIDDERFLRQAFADYFEDRLWDPIQAESAEQAIEILRTEAPDAALVDIRLPGMSGDDFIRQARLMNPRMAFVICTGSPEYLVPEDLRGELQVSGRLFKKPVSALDELENEIVHIVERIQQGGCEDE